MHQSRNSRIAEKRIIILGNGINTGTAAEKPWLDTLSIEICKLGSVVGYESKFSPDSSVLWYVTQAPFPLYFHNST